MPIFSEPKLVPFEPSPLPKGPWLVLAPHPDDETFGMGGALLLAREAGIPVEIAFVTRGELAGDPAVRTQEALQVAARLRVQEVHFLDLPDRKVYEHRDILAQKLQKLFAQKFKIIFMPSLLEFHPDHRATTWVGLAVAPFSREVWLYEISRQGEVNRLLDISPVFEEKQALMKLYASQIRENNYLEVIEGINRARTYTLSQARYAEGFFGTRAFLVSRRYGNWLKRYFQV